MDKPTDRTASEPGQAGARPSESEAAILMERALDEIQALLAERARLRLLVLDLLKAFDSPEDEQLAVKRRARDELAAG